MNRSTLKNHSTKTQATLESKPAQAELVLSLFVAQAIQGVFLMTLHHLELNQVPTYFQQIELARLFALGKI